MRTDEDKGQLESLHIACGVEIGIIMLETWQYLWPLSICCGGLNKNDPHRLRLLYMFCQLVVFGGNCRTFGRWSFAGENKSLGGTFECLWSLSTVMPLPLLCAWNVVYKLPALTVLPQQWWTSIPLKLQTQINASFYMLHQSLCFNTAREKK